MCSKTLEGSITNFYRFQSVFKWHLLPYKEHLKFSNKIQDKSFKYLFFSYFGKLSIILLYREVITSLWMREQYLVKHNFFSQYFQRRSYPTFRWAVLPFKSNHRYGINFKGNTNFCKRLFNFLLNTHWS